LVPVSFFFIILRLNDDEVNRECPARNTKVQLSAPTLTLSATIQCYWQTDRQTDRQMTISYQEVIILQLDWLNVAKHVVVNLSWTACL